jgi:hypothetical protein
MPDTRLQLVLVTAFMRGMADALKVKLLAAPACLDLRTVALQGLKLLSVKVARTRPMVWKDQLLA